MNVLFSKDGQTRFVKHGFSWQIGLFGPLAYLMRGQYKLALLSVPALWLIHVLAGGVFIMLLDVPVMVAHLIGYAAIIAAAGRWGNRFSARDYVKKGWKPVESFPEDWNTPALPQLNPVL